MKNKNAMWRFKKHRLGFDTSKDTENIIMSRNTCHDATRGKKGFKCQHTLILYSVDFTSSLCHRLLLETSTLHSCCRFVPFHHMPEVMDLRSADCGGYFVTVNSLRVQEATLRLFELCKIACLSNGSFHQ